MPRVHPDAGQMDEKCKRARLRSKSSESKDESSESEESIYNTWKNKLKRLKRNRRMIKNEKIKKQEEIEYRVNNAIKSANLKPKTKQHKRLMNEIMVDWESKTPFVFTLLGSRFPPIAEAEETLLTDDVNSG